jgi:hypothetical protein
MDRFNVFFPKPDHLMPGKKQAAPQMLKDELALVL